MQAVNGSLFVEDVLSLFKGFLFVCEVLPCFVSDMDWHSNKCSS